MDKNKIGEKLRKLRGKRTRKEVAGAIGTGISIIGMYERGDRIPGDDIKVKLAEYYGRSVQEIFFC